MRVDCDQDAILLKVEMAGDGVACHQGYRSCFYRTVPLGEPDEPGAQLGFDRAMPRGRRGEAVKDRFTLLLRRCASASTDL